MEVLIDRDSLEGPVTREKWKCWKRPGHYDSLTNSNPNFPRLFEEQNVVEFDLLSQSKIIVQDFFTWALPFRKIVEVFILDANPIEDIEAFVKLASIVEPVGDPACFKNDRGRDVVYYLSNKLYSKSIFVDSDSSGMPSVDLEYLLSSFDAMYNDHTRELTKSIVLLLALVHGSRVVEDVLRAWTRGSCPGAPSDFALVVEDWQNLQQYPIEWAVSIVQDSSSSDE